MNKHHLCTDLKFWCISICSSLTLIWLGVWKEARRSSHVSNSLVISLDAAVENSGRILLKPGATNYLSREAPEPFISAGDMGSFWLLQAQQWFQAKQKNQLCRRLNSFAAI